MLLNFHSCNSMWINILQGTTEPGITLPWLGVDKQPKPPTKDKLGGCWWSMNRKNTWETAMKVHLMALSNLHLPTWRNALFLQQQSFELLNILPFSSNNINTAIVKNISSTSWCRCSFKPTQWGLHSTVNVSLLFLSSTCLFLLDLNRMVFIDSWFIVMSLLFIATSS